MITHPGFSVLLDARTRSLRVTACGLWSIKTVDAYHEAISMEIARYRALGGRPMSLDVLIDVADGGVQQAAIAERLKATIGIYLPFSRRIALLIAKSALKRIQVRRTITSERQQIFESRAEAEAWLREPDSGYKKAS